MKKYLLVTASMLAKALTGLPAPRRSPHDHLPHCLQVRLRPMPLGMFLNRATDDTVNCIVPLLVFEMDWNGLWGADWSLVTPIFIVTESQYAKHAKAGDTFIELPEGGRLWP